MHIVGSFIEDLTRTQVLERASSYLHLYLAVQHIHDRVGVMTVKGTREIRVILYAKADLFCATALADELSVEDILAIEHDVIPLDGTDVF
jgi:hypothetical protein